MFLGLMVMVVAAIAFPAQKDPFWAWVVVALRLSMLICLAQQPWGGVFARLLAFGLAVGAFSIFPDHLLTRAGNNALRAYEPGTAPWMLSSPLFVPLFWTCATVEYGYAITRVWGQIRRNVKGELALGIAMAAGAFLAAVTTASSEFLAVRAGWWHYVGPSGALLGDAVSFHVVLGHFLAWFFFLPVFARYLRSPGTRTFAATSYGGVFAGIVFLSYLVADFLVRP
jgi:hypothetical protein